MSTRRILFGFFVFLLWSLYVLYPNPAYFAKSVYRIYDPPVNPYLEEIQYLALLTNDKSPTETERFIKGAFPYQYDWKTYNVPWYFPTTEEAVRNQMGDCKTRYIITASVFKAKEIPYTLSFSPSHIWVDYEGKVSTVNENQEVAMFVSGKGVSFPKMELRSSSRSFLKAFWDPMPEEKKKLFFWGFFFASLFAFTPEKKRSLLSYRAEK